MRNLIALMLVMPLPLYAECKEIGRAHPSEKAAFALSKCYLARSVREDREFIAAILRREDRFTVVVANGEPGSGDAHLRIRLPQGARLAALWHTHGAPAMGRELFSPVDTRVAHELDLPFYLSDPHGVLRLYEAGGRTRQRNVRRRFSGSKLQAPATSSQGRELARTGHHRLR